jgi:hypothetical protein
MTIVDTNQIIVPSNPAVIKAIKDAMQEASSSYTRIEGEKDFLKELFANLSEGSELPVKYLKKISKIYHAQNLAAVATDQDNIVELYGTVFPESNLG